MGFHEKQKSNPLLWTYIRRKYFNNVSAKTNTGLGHIPFVQTGLGFSDNTGLGFACTNVVKRFGFGAVAIATSVTTSLFLLQGSYRSWKSLEKFGIQIVNFPALENHGKWP